VAKATCLNNNSSRSHAVVKIFLDFEDDDIDDENGDMEDDEQDNDSGFAPEADVAIRESARTLTSRRNAAGSGPLDTVSVSTIRSTTMEDNATNTNSSGRSLSMPNTANTLTTLAASSSAGGASPLTPVQSSNLKTRSVSSSTSASRQNSVGSIASHRSRQKRLFGATQANNLTNTLTTLTSTQTDATVGEYGYDDDSMLPTHRTGEKNYSFDQVNSEADRIVAHLGTAQPRLRFRRRVLTLVDLAGLSLPMLCCHSLQ
jgi:hypothetical protein